MSPDQFWKNECHRMEQDKYEYKLIEVKESKMQGAGRLICVWKKQFFYLQSFLTLYLHLEGEGVFLKTDVVAGTVVAFYNGIRVTKADDSSWEDCSYRIFIKNEESEEADDEYDILDIPPEFRGTNSYSATLAHKINHSFRPNCKFR